MSRRLGARAWRPRKVASSAAVGCGRAYGIFALERPGAIGGLIVAPAARRRGLARSGPASVRRSRQLPVVVVKTSRARRLSLMAPSPPLWSQRVWLRQPAVGLRQGFAGHCQPARDSQIERPRGIAVVMAGVAMIFSRPTRHLTDQKCDRPGLGSVGAAWFEARTRGEEQANKPETR